MSNTFSINRNKAKYPVILLFGPTGVGKTEILIQEFASGYEVISADSMQVYRGLDIGTAKPDARERSAVAHHLIDIKEPFEQFQVGEFVRLADSCVQAVSSRGNIPILSGGTAFYFKHFLFGLPAAPKADYELRQSLQKELEREGLSRMCARLRQVDPESASRISSQDAYRILRALEVYESSGRPLSHYRMPEKIRDHLSPVIIGLRRSREELAARIDRRVRSMVSAGLCREVQQLLKQGASPAWPGMKGIGYREFFTYRDSGEQSLEVLVREIADHSKKYAKQQMTFFRSLPGVHWLHPDERTAIRALAPGRGR